MKKNDFICLLAGVIGGLLFALGMCMVLLPEWNAFEEGVALAAVGAVVLLALAVARRRMSGKKLALPGPKVLGGIALGVVGTLVLGAGMCLIMVWDLMLPGILAGILGIILLLCLIPLCAGLKE